MQRAGPITGSSRHNNQPPNHPRQSGLLDSHAAAAAAAGDDSAPPPVLLWSRLRSWHAIAARLWGEDELAAWLGTRDLGAEIDALERRLTAEHAVWVAVCHNDLQVGDLLCVCGWVWAGAFLLLIAAPLLSFPCTLAVWRLYGARADLAC